MGRPPQEPGKTLGLPRVPVEIQTADREWPSASLPGPLFYAPDPPKTDAQPFSPLVLPSKRVGGSFLFEHPVQPRHLRGSHMTIREAKTQGIRKLHGEAREAEILLAHVLGISREEALAHDERQVPASVLSRYRRLLDRRGRHEPVAYLTGRKEFFGLRFAVNKHTLVPRPETEMLVETAIQELKTSSQQLVIDVGTGSGAIAVSIAKNAPEATIIATDISKPALMVARRNAAANGVEDRIIFVEADLLRGQTPYYSKKGSAPFSPIITANLPYIPTADWRKCMPDVKNFEPRRALDGGVDGLRLYDKLFRQIIALKIAPAAIICEIDPGQKKTFPRLAKQYFPGASAEIKSDLAGRARIAIISFKSL